MSLRTASCPGCGATLEFRNAATLVVVCPFCGSASYRTDVDLTLIGKVAAVAPIESPLDLATAGRFEGVGWTCVGQIQLDHGAGPWNEWCLLFDDGSWGWLAEAQGELLLTRKMDGVEAPPLESLQPGAELTLGSAGRFVVAEVGEGTVTAVRGELPARVVPGDVVHYADLRGPGGGFATLDFGAGTTCEAVYVGRVVTAEDMGLPTEPAAPTERRAEARRVACPNCAGTVELKDPDSVRAGCGNCGALLDTASEAVRMLGLSEKLKSKPSIPLGATGTLLLEKVEVLAFLVRSVVVDGIRYPWREYLLKAGSGAYRWLVEWQGHWLWTKSIPLADVQRSGLTARARGQEFKHFQGAMARVDYVLGEVYWEVEVGETVRCDDFVAPPNMLSLEKSGKEIVASLGTYVPAADVTAAFALRFPLREPHGVAPAQPNPYVGNTGRWWAAGLSMTLTLLVLMLVVSGAGRSEDVGFVFPGLVFAFLILLPPIVVSSRRSSFEKKRWAESDHPIGGAYDDE